MIGVWGVGHSLEPIWSAAARRRFGRREKLGLMGAGNYPPISPRNADGEKIRGIGGMGELELGMSWDFLDSRGRRKDQSGVRRLDAALDEGKGSTFPIKLIQHSGFDPSGRPAAFQSLGYKSRLNKAASSRRTPDWFTRVPRLNDSDGFPAPASK